MVATKEATLAWLMVRLESKRGQLIPEIPGLYEAAQLGADEILLKDPIILPGGGRWWNTAKAADLAEMLQPDMPEVMPEGQLDQATYDALLAKHTADNTGYAPTLASWRSEGLI